MEMFACPFCNWKGKSFMGLKYHIHGHVIDGICPVCGKNYRNLSLHAGREAKRGCFDHKVLYGLMPNGRNKTATEFKKMCRQEAYEFCEVI